MNTILKYLKTTLEILFIILFILFEQIIWERIALPIGRFIASLKILDSFKALILRQTRYTILAIFLIPLFIAEWMGIRSGVLLVSGNILSAIFLYIAKIPVASITFWIFSFTKDHLLSFDWFKTLFELLIRFINFIKNTAQYKSVIARVNKVKEIIKAKYVEFKVWFKVWFKEVYPTDDEFKEHIKNIYVNIKKSFDSDNTSTDKKSEKKMKKSKKKTKKKKSKAKSKVDSDTINKKEGI